MSTILLELDWAKAGVASNAMNPIAILVIGAVKLPPVLRIKRPVPLIAVWSAPLRVDTV